MSVELDSQLGCALSYVLPIYAASEGFVDPNFANEWALPPTAVYGTPNNQDNGIPAELPANGKGAMAPTASGRPNQ